MQYFDKKFFANDSVFSTEEPVSGNTDALRKSQKHPALLQFFAAFPY